MIYFISVRCLQRLLLRIIRGLNVDALVVKNNATIMEISIYFGWALDPWLTVLDFT